LAENSAYEEEACQILVSQRVLFARRRRLLPVRVTQSLAEERRDSLWIGLSSVGISLSVLFYAARSFQGWSLSFGRDCMNLLFGYGCRPAFMSAFASDFCGPTARHRLLMAAGLVGLSISGALFLSGLIRGHRPAAVIETRGLLRGRAWISACVGIALGTAAGFWTYGGFDMCDKFTSRWEAALAGLGIAAGAWVIGSLLTARRIRARPAHFRQSASSGPG
jgi:hypothetical protein